MKKKFLLLTLLVTPLGVSVTACKDKVPSNVTVDENGKEHKLRETYSFDGNYHWLECTDCYNFFKRGPHAWNSGEVTKAATNDQEGIKTYTCSICNATKTETIPSPAATETNPISSSGSFFSKVSDF